MKTERIKWIDVAKGLCIILVVFGHCITREGAGKVVFLNRLIYSFHMPLFFMLSGINLKTDIPFMEFIKKRITRVLLPMYGFMIGYNICMAFISIFNGNYTHYIAQIDAAAILKSILCLRTSLIVNWWFLPALFTAQILLFIIDKIPIVILKIATFVIGFLLCMLNYHKMNIAFPFFLETAALALPFLAIGFYGKELFYRWERFSGFIIAGLIWAACIVISVKCGYGAVNMLNGNIHNPFLFFAGGLSGSYIAVYFAKKTQGLSLFQKLGRETLWIYGIHYIFLNIFCEIVEGYDINSQFLYNLSTVFIGALLILLCCYFVVILKERIIQSRSHT